MEQGTQIETLISAVDTTSTKVDRIHDALFGIEGRGGLYKMVEDHEDAVRKLTEHKNRAIGGLTVLSLLCGALGGIVVKLLK